MHGVVAAVAPSGQTPADTPRRTSSAAAVDASTRATGSAPPPASGGTYVHSNATAVPAMLRRLQTSNTPPGAVPEQHAPTAHHHITSSTDVTFAPPRSRASNKDLEASSSK